MHPFDSGILPKKQAKADQFNSVPQVRVAVSPATWLNRLTHRWSIHQKIGCGYILAVSIAVLGTGAGLVVGEHYDDKAVKQLRTAQERHEVMNHLEKAVLEVKLHQQRIIATPENNLHQQTEITQLLESIAEAKAYLSELKANLADHGGLPVEYAANLETFLQTCSTELESYAQLVQQLLQNATIDNPTPRDIQATNQFLWLATKGEPATELEQLSNNLEQLVKSTIAQEKQASATFRAAEALRLLIILSSMVLSVAIAAALALYTSRAIAHPIKAVTKVAKQATQEGNFDLQAPVTTEDEIGVLATSLNHLIQRVATQIRELQQAQAHLIQSEKMSGLGQMVAGIAHEINNPANFIYGNIQYTSDYTQQLLDLLQLYQHYYPQPVPEIQTKLEEIDLSFINEDLPKILSSMYVGSERIRQIILSLRNFSRLDEAEMKQVDIHEGIENSLLILSHRTNQKIEVIKNYRNLPLVKCYPAQLNQVFMNILSNAIDELIAHPELSQPQICIETKLMDATQIQVQIRDNGFGIAPEIKDKVFDPFFTTKPVGQGTGMGLAICYQVVEKHHGRVEIISELGKGAEFVVTLPLEPT